MLPPLGMQLISSPPLSKYTSEPLLSDKILLPLVMRSSHVFLLDLYQESKYHHQQCSSPSCNLPSTARIYGTVTLPLIWSLPATLQKQSSTQGNHQWLANASFFAVAAALLIKDFTRTSPLRWRRPVIDGSSSPFREFSA